MKQNHTIKDSLSEFEDLFVKLEETVLDEIGGFNKEAIALLEKVNEVVYYIDSYEEVDDILVEVGKVKELVEDALRVLR